VTGVEFWLVVFVGVSTLVFTVQCIALLVTGLTIKQMAARLETQRKEVESNLSVVQDRLLKLSEDLQPLRNMAENIGSTANVVSDTLRERAKDLDQFIQELMTVGREQASKVDHLVTDTVQKFEQTTEVIQKDILQPAVEISSFIKGIKSGLEALFSRKPVGARDKSAEEEFFC